ncbi:hypothetical protein HYE01_02705 [Mycoplasmopsis bovis]|nr:hypothetical protein HYE01_02705 [Mycoplasmopsis bovis]
MKKFSFVLLPILTFPAIGCLLVIIQQRQSRQQEEGEKVLCFLSENDDELKKIKDELQDEIDKALQKRDAYFWWCGN